MTPMTHEQLERFEAVAYAYRSWPGSDHAGVVARFAELVKHVEELMKAAVQESRDWDAKGY